MKINETLKISIYSLLSYKLRSLLTILGIAIGISSVLIVLTIGYVGENQLNKFLGGEKNSLNIVYQPESDSFQKTPSDFSESGINENDIQNLKEMNFIEKVAASASNNSKVYYKNKLTDVTSIGITEDYLESKKYTITGNIFSTMQYLNNSYGAIISRDLSIKLFDSEKSSLGKIFYLNEYPIEVIGIIKNNKETPSLNLTDTILLPWKTWSTIYETKNFNQLTIVTKSEKNLSYIEKSSKKMLNESHGTKNSFQTINSKVVSSSITQVTKTITLIIGSIAGVSLLVASIGVMNIMLVSVTERTREIGIRKAIGASTQQILVQFLLEAILISLIGCFLGIFLGISISYLICLAFKLEFIMDIFAIIKLLIFSIIIGIIFGILPANKAAQLNPIDTLKYE